MLFWAALFHVLLIQVSHFIRVASLTAQVRKIKVRVGRLKAQVEAIKPRVE